MLFEPRGNFNFFTHLRFKKSWSTSKSRKSTGGSSETPPKPSPNHHHHHHRFAFAQLPYFNSPRHDWRRHFLEPWTCEQPKWVLPCHQIPGTSPEESSMKFTGKNKHIFEKKKKVHFTGCHGFFCSKWMFKHQSLRRASAPSCDLSITVPCC